MTKKKNRGFEVVDEQHRTAFDIFTDEKKKEHKFPKEIKLPTRADSRSAGYDFYLPKDIRILPQQKTIVWTDVKAYMQEDEVLELYIRSSLATKQGLMLSNSVGIVDSSYYGNSGNDGNIGIAVVNTSGKTIELKAGERLAQGIFKKYLTGEHLAQGIVKKYLTADTDATQKEERDGGFGSSGK